MSTGCPENERLVGLTLGTLPEGDSNALAAHLEGCPSCEERLRALEALRGPLLDELRRAEGAAEDVPGPLLVRLRLAGLARPPQDLAGRRLGRFELMEKLGTGSFAQVYRAWDP